jgi:hypothetical protein
MLIYSDCLFPKEVNWQECEADRSTLTSAKVKIYKSTLPYAFVA